MNVSETINMWVEIVGLVLIATLVRGGFQYITAADDSSKVMKAMALMTSALIGLVGLVLITLGFKGLI